MAKPPNKMDRRDLSGPGCLLLVCLAVVALIVSPTTRKACVAIAGVLVVVGCIGFVAMSIVNRVRMRRAMKLLQGRVVLVWTRRHGWNEMTVNNLLPTIDTARVYPLCRQATEADRDSDPLCGRLYDLVANFPGQREVPLSPFLLSFSPTIGKVERVSQLNHRLQPFKSLRRRSEISQANIRPVLEKLIEEHCSAMRT